MSLKTFDEMKFVTILLKAGLGVGLLLLMTGVVLHTLAVEFASLEELSFKAGLLVLALTPPLKSLFIGWNAFAKHKPVQGAMAILVVIILGAVFWLH